mmetsp:Transcript_14255/g.18685  ORF Transcript_14255/g.18685 Transcript_14255/m.18685 type:complete len:87 (+) Transcript_14255:922-1182(+)
MMMSCIRSFLVIASELLDRYYFLENDNEINFSFDEMNRLIFFCTTYVSKYFCSQIIASSSEKEIINILCTSSSEHELYRYQLSQLK